MKKIIFSIIAIVGIASFAHSQRYAAVDSEYILSNIPEYETAQNQLNELTAEWQKEIEAKFRDIDKMYKAYQAESVLLPDDIKKKRENEIINAEKQAKDLQKQRFGNEGDLFKKRQELIKPIQDRIFNAIEKRSKDKYAFVFDKAGSLTMLYVDPKYDISDEILSDLGYSAKKK